MRSKTLTTLKQFDWACIILLVYYLSYNWYFGFNMHPKSHAEEVCDSIAQGLAGISIGLFISALSSFMGLVVRYIQRQTMNDR